MGVIDDWMIARVMTIVASGCASQLLGVISS